MSSTSEARRCFVAVAALVLVVLVAAGCSMDRWIKVEPGEYIVVDDRAATYEAAGRAIKQLRVVRDERLLTFTLADGSEILTSFVARERSAWPSGCPSNIQSTRREVLEIAQNPLITAGTRIGDPVLVRDCPTDPVRIVLREDGAMGGGGGACLYPARCIVFAPGSTANPLNPPLPRSMKGYELYSWQEGQEWRYTLITGTNRLKEVGEIASLDSVVSDDGWVKVTVVGIEELKAMLGRLPEGESVAWISEEWLEAVGALNGDLQLPSPEMVEEIVRYSQSLGIDLQVADRRKPLEGS